MKTTEAIDFKKFSCVSENFCILGKTDQIFLFINSLVK